MYKHIAFDPSEKNFGYAVILCESCNKDAETMFNRTIVTYGTIKPVEKTLISRLSHISIELKELRNRYIDFKTPTFVWIEEQAFWDSKKGFNAAAKQDIIKSAASSGLPIPIFMDVAKITLVSPIKWRGQVPEKTLKNRIANKYAISLKGLDSHSIDALGLALYGASQV